MFEQGLTRYCKHSGLLWQGSLTVRDRGYKTEFVTPEKLEAAREFARKLHARVLPPSTDTPLSIVVAE